MMEPDQAELDAQIVDSHVAKWLHQAPEMDVALPFTGAGRARARLWGALLSEWLDALFGLTDLHVAEVKLAWWGEALSMPAEEAPHPLVQALGQTTNQAVSAAQWQTMAEAALRLLGRETSPADMNALIQVRLPLAQALNEVETTLWPQTGPGNAQAVARNLVLEQWRRHHHQADVQPAWLPLQLLARHGLRARAAYAMEDMAASQHLLADLATTLASIPVTEAGPRLRRLRTRLDSRILLRLGAGRKHAFALSGFSVPWQCWRAVRGVPA